MYQRWGFQMTGKMRNCGSKYSFMCLNLSGHNNDQIKDPIELLFKLKGICLEFLTLEIAEYQNIIANFAL